MWTIKGMMVLELLYMSLNFAWFSCDDKKFGQNE